MQKVRDIFNPKPKLSKRFNRYMAIMDRGVITKQETVVLKSILSNHGLRHSITDKEQALSLDRFETVEQGKIRITPEHTEQGLKFLKALIYTPTGSVRRKWKQYIDALVCDGSTETEVKDIIDNFSHFEFAGFEGLDYNGYRDAYNYTPVWRTVAKNGESFEYAQRCQSEVENRRGRY